MQHSTAEVEEELMQLWSSVEKDREAAEAQRAQHAERLRRRQERRETKVAPLSSGEAADGGGTDYSARWQRLDPAEDDDDNEEAPGAATGHTQAAAAAAAAGGGAEAGGVGLREAEDQRRGLLRAEAPSNSDDRGPAEQEHDLEELPLHDLEAPARQQGAAEGWHGAEAGVGGGQSPAPPSEQQQQRQGQGQSEDGEDKASPGGSPTASSTAGGLWQPAAEQHQPVTARHGAGQAGFWRTFRDMMGDIHIVACGPERQALLVGGRAGMGRQTRFVRLPGGGGALGPRLARCMPWQTALNALADLPHMPRGPVIWNDRPPRPTPAPPPADVPVAGLLQPGLCLHIHHQLCAPGKDS